jgi:uncharacterized protein YdaU (DUF1376 family)
MHYYQFHIGDYVKDTGHLSILEHGCYRRLLDWAYSSEKALPVEDEKIFQICGARSVPEKKAVRSVVAEFFPATEAGRVNGRVLREVAEFRGLSVKNALKALNRWRAVKNLPPLTELPPDYHSHAAAFPPQSSSSAGVMQRARVPIPINHKPVTIEREQEAAEGSPPVKIPLSLALDWLAGVVGDGADYTTAEVEQAWRDFHMTRMQDGTWRQWTTTKTPVSDYRYALEDRIQHNRRAFPSRTGADTGSREPGTEKNREKIAPSGGALEGMSPAQARFKWERELEELGAEMQSDHELNQPPDAEKSRRAKELREKLKGLAA